jgi:DNA-binding winged helix-turn-helix (wHTH) protein/tetratricopeptide (TPR) repeat protein
VAQGKGESYSFLDCTLDVANARLQRGRSAFPLRPKTLAVLHCLVRSAGRLVTKEELIAEVWDGAAVSDWVLTRVIRELRSSLGDDARKPRVIETVHRRGYRFVAPLAAPVIPAEPDRSSGAASAIVVGREPDLATLAAWWQDASRGASVVGFVLGDPGMGKTTLVDEFVRVATESPLRPFVARGQCIEQFGAGEPWLPLLEALGRLCGDPETGPMLVDLLRRWAPAWLVQLPGVLAPDECEALERRLGATTRERMLREFAAVVAALPAPLLLVVEDLHWSDQATLDVVSMLAQRRDAGSLLLLATFRPLEVVLRDHPLRALQLALRGRDRCRELWLPPLDEAATKSLLGRRWPGLEDAAALARVVQEHTDGNPLFLINVVEYLAASGAVVPADGGWRIRGDAVTLAAAVPTELRPLVAAQVERLGEEERVALEAASLVGRRFSAALVAAALDVDLVAVECRLAGMADAGLLVCADGTGVWPDGTMAGAFRFTHFFYQSVIRDRVLPARRQQLHRRIADCLERAWGGHAGEIAADLAHHLEAAGLGERAVPYFARSAERALASGAAREAEVLLRRGLAIFDALPPAPERAALSAALRLTLGRVLAPARSPGDAAVEASYLAARHLSEQAGSPLSRFEALFALTTTYIAQARFEDARLALHEIHAMLPTIPEAPGSFAGSFLAGALEYHGGSLAIARPLLERAVDPERPVRVTLGLDLRLVASAYLSLVIMHLGFVDAARELLARAMKQAVGLDAPVNRGFVAQAGCFLHMNLRDADGLEACAGVATGLVELPAMEAVGRFSQGRVLSLRGDHEPALAGMRAAVDAYRKTGQRVALPALLATLADAARAAGDDSAAIACIREARTLAQTTGEIRQLPELDRLEGSLLGGDRRQADACFRRALAAARQHGAFWLELRTAASAARAALDFGAAPATRRARRRQLAAALDRVREGSDAPDVIEAQRVLDALD